MSSGSYFYDQSSRVSHLGGIHRSKRNLKDLNQALCQSKVAVTFQEGQINPNDSINPEKTFEHIPMPLLPDIILKELDSTLQTSDENHSQTTLPSSLILQFHSTWNDLIKNTEYKQKIWRTKAGEDAWRHYLQRKRLEQLKSEKQQIIHENKIRQRQSIASGTHGLHRPSLGTHLQSSRPSSRGSVMSTTDIIQENHRPAKAVADQSGETIKNGVHVEFKFSTQVFKTVHKSPIVEPKFVLFDVQKPGINFYQEMILSTQNKCKRFLAEAKQKILATTNDGKPLKICQVWFYDDNPFMKNKNNLLLLNESSRRQRAKFVLSILRREIPVKYNINIEIPEMKKKCYIELPDGSSQIYYPSGRLAVLRLRSLISTILFFDDTTIPTKQFLGLVTSSGNVLVMQPTFHTRFITNNRYEYAYLCHGKTGLIENQLQWSFKRNIHRQSTLFHEDDDDDDDNQHIPLIENTVQLQLNSSMQLEYQNPSNIRFAFSCHSEEFKYQLGSSILRTHSPIVMDSTSLTRKFSKKRTSSINANEYLHQKSNDEQMDLYHLPIMKELIIMRKRIKTLCETWLKEYRTILGIMDIEAYCLADLSPPTNEDENIKPSETVSSSPIQIDKSRSTKRTDKNIITQSIEQFIPRSEIGRRMKQRIHSRKSILSTTLPIIK
ncbi:hypothetical protein I4U23_021653 [Adineta vaga]|nr:hypothetical protein I4U23_021653 [Adineta vaga]